jgi:hypothetical protein
MFQFTMMSARDTLVSTVMGLACKQRRRERRGVGGGERRGW